jgi:hypothetical protein
MGFAFFFHFPNKNNIYRINFQKEKKQQHTMVHVSKFIYAIVGANNPHLDVTNNGKKNCAVVLIKIMMRY